MALVTEPIALDRSLNTTESPSRNIADVLAEELSAIITAIGGLNFINFVVVAELPTTGISTTTIYLVPSDDPQSGNTYDEYINLNGTVSGWEKIGSTDIDLSGYYTSAEVDTLLADKADVSDIPTVNDGTLTIQQNGETKGTFTANQSGNSTVNIEIPTTDIQTAVDEFETYNGGLLSSLKVALSPNQDLHGYSEPWVGGASKNKLPMTLANIIALNTDGTWNGNIYTFRGIDYTVLVDDANNIIGFDTNGTATQRGWFFITEYDFGETDAVYNNVTVGGYIFTAGNSAYIDNQQMIYYNHGSKRTYFIMDGITTNHVKWYPMVRLSSESDPTFAPYSNICPISGHTQVKVGDDGKNLFVPTDIISGMRLTNITGTAYNSTQDVIAESNSFVSSLIKVTQGNIVTKNSPNEDAYHRWHIYDSNGICVRFASDNVITIGSGESYVALCGVNSEIDTTQIREGYQITVNLGGTYYSGTLDVVSGVFTPDTAEKVYDGSSDENWIKVSGENRYYIEKPSDINANPDGSTSNEFKYSGTSGASVPDGQFYVGGTNLGVRLNTITSVADWKTFLSNNPMTVVYPLATPTPIQLSPTMVKALVGENHLSAPLGGQEITESKYRELFTWDEVEAYVNTHSGGGSGMNYSTDEQVVGTWIDNKPLYAKTIVYTPSGTISSNTTIANVPNAKVMRVTEATAYNPNENRGYTLPDVRANGGTKITYDNGDVTLEIISDSWSSSWTFYVTVQYTKTTD